MKKIVLFLVFSSFFKLFACDRTSVAIISSSGTGSPVVYTYNVQVCLGISPNWGATTSFTLNANEAITGTSTTLTSTYNYCSVNVAFNGAGCAVSSMGQPAAGGTIQTANVTATSSTSGGNLTFTAPGSSWLGPDDLRGDCADCRNPSQLCFDITFTTSAAITTLDLVGGEGGTNCPDELVSNIPAPYVCIPATLTAVVTGGPTSITICEGDAIDLSSACTGCVTGSGATTYSWSGPAPFSSSTSSNPASFTAASTSGGTYTLSGTTPAPGGNTCPTTTSTVSVILNPKPTATLDTASVAGCTTTSVPISFTGAAPYTFTYRINGVNQTPITTSTNPYILTVTSSGTITLNATAGVTNTTCAGAGPVYGSTPVSISAVNSAAGNNFIPTANTNYTINATGTPGNNGYSTTSTTSSQSNGTDYTLNANTVTSTIALSGITANCPMDINNMPVGNSVCFDYIHAKANAELSAQLCIGATCISAPLGAIPKTNNTQAKTYCFDYGDVLTLISGASCTATLSLKITDASGGNTGTLTGWSTTFNDVTSTLNPNPSYLWSVSSGGANLSYLTSSTIEDPVFNAPGGTLAGCYNLRVTDGAGCLSNDEVCYNAIPLYFNFSYFNAILLNKNVHLNWSFEQSLNHESYLVERSNNGVDDFIEISDKITSEGNSNFEYIDNTTFENNYYRIKITKNDGSIEYSFVRYISLKETNDFKLNSIYPVPTNTELNLDIYCGEKKYIQLKAFDMYGKIVIYKEYTLEKGIQTLKLDLNEISSGAYLLQLSSDEFHISTKIIKR